MKQITQKEFIKFIEEKQKEAKNIFYSTKDSEKDFGEAQLKKARLLGEMDTYQTIICKLKDVEIIPEANQEAKICDCYDAVYKRCNGTKEREECYCEGDVKNCTHYPEKRSKTSIPEHEEEKELLEPLCNFCNKTEEECPFHRIGSAYEDCSWFEEQKPHEIRNDRFKEFENITSKTLSKKEMVDAKSVTLIRFYKNQEGCIVDIWCSSGIATSEEFTEEGKAEAYYDALVEWWKYWKQN